MIERVRPKSRVPSPVLITESAEEFERFHDAFNDELSPRGPLERHLVGHMAEKVWKIRRLNRVKTTVINTALRPALNAILLDRGDPRQWQNSLNTLVNRLCSDERDKKGVLKIVEQVIKLDESAIEAAAIQLIAEDLEKIDRLIASQESRLSKDLCLLAELRGGLGRQLHAKVERIIDGKVLALDDASKKSPIGGITMATDRQIAANRRNARRSTGPRSRAGRKRSSRNSFRHGLAAGVITNAERIKWIERLARKIAGDGADIVTLEWARTIAQAEFELEHPTGQARSDIAYRDVKRI
jgi:hypothetical protein